MYLDMFMESHQTNLSIFDATPPPIPKLPRGGIEREHLGYVFSVVQEAKPCALNKMSGFNEQDGGIVWQKRYNSVTLDQCQKACDTLYMKFSEDTALATADPVRKVISDIHTADHDGLQEEYKTHDVPCLSSYKGHSGREGYGGYKGYGGHGRCDVKLKRGREKEDGTMSFDLCDIEVLNVVCLLG